MEALVSPYPQPVSTEYGLCMRAIECLPSVTTSAATSVAKPGNPPGADSMEAVLQVLLTMASKNPKISSKLQGCFFFYFMPLIGRVKNCTARVV